MKSESINIPSVLLGTTPIGLLVLIGFGVAWSQTIPPSVFSTGRIPLDLIEQLPDFELSTDPSEQTLKIGHYSTYTRNFVVYSIYGDLRLERFQRVRSPESETITVQLQYEEVRQLVRLAILCGLVETDQAALSRKVREAGIERSNQIRTPGKAQPLPPPPPADSARSDFEVNLARIGTVGARSNRLSIFGLDNRAELFPDIPELQGWLGLGRLVSEKFEE